MSTTKLAPIEKCNTCACRDCAASELGKLYKLNAALDNAYEILGVGLAFFDINKKATHLNELARARLHLPKEFILLERDLISECFDATSQTKIQPAMDHLLAHQSKFEVKLNVLINGTSSAIMLQKLENSAFGIDAPGIVMFMFEPKPSDESSFTDVARIFGLTKAEAKLTLAIVNGMTANEYAEKHGVSINTAYSQIKDVLAKTGTRRQAELVKLVLQHSPGYDRRTHQIANIQHDRRCTS